MAEVEEYVLRLVDQASGAAARMATQMDALDAAQTRAAESAAGVSQATKTAAGAMGGAKFVPPRDASGRFLPKGSPAYEAAKSAFDAGAPAAAAAGGLNKATAATDKFLSKRKALRDMLGGEFASRLAALREVGGPVGAAAGQISNLAAVVGRLGPYGAAAAVGLKLLTYAITAATAATAGLMAAAISVINTRARLMATFSALSFGAIGGARTLAIVERLGSVLPFATDQLAQWATGLQKAGFQGRALESAIRAVAAAEALIPGGAAAAEQLLTTLAMGGPAAMQLMAAIKRGAPEARSQLADMGLRVQDLALALGMTTAQFGRANLSARQMAEAVERALARKALGPLADLMLTFPALLTKVKEGFLSLFDGLGAPVRAFMTEVRKLAFEFSRTGSATKAMKPIVTEVMTAVFRGATQAVRAIREIAKTIAPVVTWLWQFGHSAVGIALIRGALYTVAAAMGLVAAILSPLIAGVAFLAASFALVVTIASAVIAALSSIGDALSTMVDGASGAASAFVAGLVDGITAGAGAVIGAVQGLASGALGAFKAVLGIASPSRVMRQMGGHTADGFAEGVDAGADRAQASMDAMVTPKGGASGGKGAGGFTFTNCVFGEGLTEATVRDLFNKVFAEMAAEGGAA